MTKLILFSVLLLLPLTAAAEIAIVYKQTDAFIEIWTDDGSRGKESVAIWRVNNYQSEFCSLGDVATKGYDTPTYKGLLVSQRKDGALVNPTGFSLLWTDAGSGADSDVAIYKMIAPSGYTCLGHVAVGSYSTLPDKSRYCCVENTYLGPGQTLRSYTNRGSRADKDVSLWIVVRSGADPSGVESGHFVAVGTHNPSPPSAMILEASESVRDLWSLPSSPDMDKPVDVFEARLMKMIWNSADSDSVSVLDVDCSIWRAESRDGYYPVGDVVVATHAKPRLGFLVRPVNNSVDAVRIPTNYREVWTDADRGRRDVENARHVTLWSVNCPPRFVSLGFVATNGIRRQPQPGDVYCVNSKYALYDGTFKYVWGFVTSDAGDVTIKEAIASTSKQQTVRGFVAARFGSWFVNHPTPYLLNKDYINYWAEKPIMKMYVYNVQYKLSDETQQTSPLSISPTTLINDSNEPQSIERTITYTTSTTSSFTFSLALQVGVEVEIKAGIPLIASAKTTISTSITTNFEYGKSITKEKSDSITATIDLPGKSKATAWIEGTDYKSDIPYTADVKKEYFDGTKSVGKMTGVYKGVAVSDITVRYGEEESLED